MNAIVNWSTRVVLNVKPDTYGRGVTTKSESEHGHVEVTLGGVTRRRMYHRTVRHSDPEFKLDSAFIQGLLHNERHAYCWYNYVEDTCYAHAGPRDREVPASKLTFSDDLMYEVDPPLDKVILSIRSLLVRDATELHAYPRLTELAGRWPELDLGPILDLLMTSQRMRADMMTKLSALAVDVRAQGLIDKTTKELY